MSEAILFGTSKPLERNNRWLVVNGNGIWISRTAVTTNADIQDSWLWYYALSSFNISVQYMFVVYYRTSNMSMGLISVLSHVCNWKRCQVMLFKLTSGLWENWNCAFFGDLIWSKRFEIFSDLFFIYPRLCKVDINYLMTYQERHWYDWSMYGIQINL